ncbi:LysR family transcriptional regulator [Acidimangrovimonas sediminis]|uniref:LysR family transcriptional regulator n=1 Tax=Acidimangrovimonas sediminis TaxID=2056283 RepID=UPI000C808D8C|nr:LysR family transcriptional regulator [Acidimangrovimonas sediminis]
MSGIDLNLLRALDAMLATGSVTDAARRLGLSTSAMSRTLTRLRVAVGDPLLVRAGRGLVPTPRAIALRDRLPGLLAEAEGLLAPQEAAVDLATLDRTFTLRANEGFSSLFAAPLLLALLEAAPRVRLRLAPKPEKDARPLRDGDADLEIGVLGDFAPEVRTRNLFRDRFIGAVRPDHPLLAAPVTPESYAACRHVVASRRGSMLGPVDDALDRLGLARHVVAVVPGFPDALEIARQTDLVAQVPRSCLRDDLVAVPLPVEVPGIAISAMWHPRLEADPGHRWFRETVIATVRRVAAAGSG